MGLESFTGTPWHTDKFTRADGDPRRHRSRCVYHKNDGGCAYYKESRCHGAAHCDYYKENRLEIDVPEADTNNSIVEKSAKELTDRQVMEIFPKGDKVYHEKFGTGTIVESSASRVKVLFEDGTERALSPSICLKGGLLSVEHVTQKPVEQPKTTAEPTIIELPKREKKNEIVNVYDAYEETECSQSKVASIKHETQVVAKIEIPIPGLSTDKKDRSGKTENTYTRKDERTDRTDVRANQTIGDPFDSFLKKCSKDEETERERAETYKKFNAKKKSTEKNNEFRVARVVFILCLIAIVLYFLKQFVL